MMPDENLLDLQQRETVAHEGFNPRPAIRRQIGFRRNFGGARRRNVLDDE